MTSGGVWLGIDPGAVRIGVAVSDPGASIAVPVETVKRGKHDVARICTIAQEKAAVGIFVGLPRSMSGAEGQAAGVARSFAEQVARTCPIPVRLLDERLTTVSAARGLRESGRSSRSSRAVIDQAAATVLLQAALDQMAASGSVVGELVPA
ncbi:MAG TPA: Holliday junction resolvase RuvX [Actinomycetes bacterium]|nr:Holliday junction resolvase RuvX [Actinomycetes bacterium]